MMSFQNARPSRIAGSSSRVPGGGVPGALHDDTVGLPLCGSGSDAPRNDRALGAASPKRRDRPVNPKRDLSRRRFISGGAALAALPLLSRTSSAAEVDVVVVGAGAAGLSATRELRRRGVSVATLEASSRVGGRAWTNHSLFGVPYDLGAHWLHHSEKNHFVTYAKDTEFTVYPAPDAQTLYVGGRVAGKEEHSAYDAAYRDAVDAIAAAGRRGRDVSPASVVPDAGRWHDLVHFALGPYEMAKDFDAFSCVDWWNSDDGTDSYCKEGYGTLVAHSARDLQVHLSTHVQAIDWSGSGVAVQTDRGRMRARACIVTVSTGVLASGDIRFMPALPAEKVESFHGISMGHYEHIALFFDGNVFETGPDEYLLYNAKSHRAHSPALMGLLTNVSGTGLTLADVGGDFARNLAEAGGQVAIDFARTELREIFGGAIDRHLVKGHFTRWGNNRLARGSYASAEPGAYRLRPTLRRPVGDRVWFAGEACSVSDWATVHGAHESGRDVARLVAARTR